jgi:hypothetical protein
MPGSSATLRLLYIVARGKQSLYEYVKQNFDGDPEVDVIEDRRLGPRRRQDMTVTQDRRRTDRRRQSIGTELATLGWAIVAREPDQA